MTDAWCEWLRRTAQLLQDNWQHSGLNSYRCFIVCFINSETSAAAWAARKDSFIQDSSYAKPSPPAATMGQCA
ncbi:hypothetical protein TNCV_3608571 [Trichonephila clavipes]|nr:hypothetical protein TNCV_3608571 [Trichonephila clavipes]